jgi:predicted nuclease of predicted toxin-antitoxin system
VNIVVDENIPGQTIAWLVAQGHAVSEARKPPLRAAADSVLWDTAQNELALLITTDKGFADRWTEPHHGMLIVRLRKPNRQKIHERIVLAMEQRTVADWKGLLCVMRDRTQSTRRASGIGADGAS